MPVYKLTYLNITGFGEPIRYILSYANQKYEDKRINLENWAEQKKSFPMGKVPLFEIDGKAFIQSVAITRNLGKRFKLSGKDDMEDMLMNAAVDTICDVRNAMVKYFWEQNPEVKKTLKEPLHKEIMPNYLNYLEKLIKDNNGYLVNGQLSWADIFLAGSMPYMIYTSEIDFLQDYPNMKALVEKVINLPGIKKYRDTSPKPHF